VKWSPGLEAIHGYPAGSFPGTFEAFRNEIYPADRDRMLAAIGAAVEQRRDHHVEYRIVRPDGAVRWVEGRGQLFCDTQGQPERMVGVCVDVTERKQAEETFRLAVEAAPAAMVMVDQHGTIALVNAMTEQLLGYRRDEIIGLPMDRLVPTRFRDRHPEYRTSFFGNREQRPMGAGRDLYALRKDGSEVPVEIGLSPIETADGPFVLAAVTDISQRKQVEDERARLLVREQAARTEIERASRLKDEFLAVLSHELRTPLNAVLGYAHLLTSRALPPERSAHALDAIQRNAQAQARLVESLLDLSRIMAGKLELDRERVDLSTVVNAAIDVIRPEADAKGISVDVEMPTSGIALVGDGGRLQQVFWNLLSNAVKFSPRSGRVGLRVAQQDSEVRVQVSDNGKGIEPDFLPHVFERFKQSDSHKGRSPVGLGLGLALVREMVQAHGGTVVAESPGDGHGSTFTVTLPLSTGVPVPEPKETSALRVDAVESLPHIDILIVDDDADARDLLALLLESRGAVARSASSATEALEAISQRRPDVLLADVRMPDEDGYSLIRKVRAGERERQQGRLPAIAVTAYASAKDREEAIAAGYDWHVAKPVDPGELARAIAKVAKADSV
jgi:PAS domain S-box-containing protein